MTPDADAGQAHSPVLAVLPVKSLELAKSRLALPAEQRRKLALAFAADTLRALTECPELDSIVVVTADADIARLAHDAGASLAPDEGDTLDAAIAVALSTVLPDRTHSTVLVSPADLPCLRPEDVSSVLELARTELGRRRRGHDAFVPDRAGTGTTMVIHSPGRPIVTRYGPDSAARHTALGLTPLAVAPARARHDVDTLADLHAAVELGLGPRTAAAVADLLDLTRRRWQPTP